MRTILLIPRFYHTPNRTDYQRWMTVPRSVSPRRDMGTEHSLCERLKRNWRTNLVSEKSHHSGTSWEKNCSIVLASYKYRCVHSSLGIWHEKSGFVSGGFLKLPRCFSVFIRYSYVFNLSLKKIMKAIGALVWPVEFFENGLASSKRRSTRKWQVP